MARRRPYVANRGIAQAAGYGCLLLGSFLLYDAYERRGRTKPFVAKLIPGA